MPKTHVKLYSASVIIREMQIKTTMKYHLTSVRMAIIKNSTNNKHWRKCGEKGTVLHCLWECKLVQSLWRTIWRFLRKLTIELLYDPAISLWTYLEKNMIQKDIGTIMFLLFIIAKTWKQPNYPLTDEWMKKMWYINTMGYYSSIKKNRKCHLHQHGWT